METQVMNNNYICDTEVLSIAYDAMHTTIDKLEENGRDIEPFLADYILYGNLNNFTRGNNKYRNAREIMESIDKETLKRELFAMLVGNAKYNLGVTKVIFKKPNISFPLNTGIESLFREADSSTIEYLFNQLYDKMPEQLNQYIDEKLKEMIHEMENNNEKSWLLKSYYQYDEKDLNTIEKIRKGKKHLKVIAIRRVNNDVKTLKKDYDEGYYKSRRL